MNSDRKRRLFLALWPDPGIRARLAEIADEWSYRPVVAANLHMTLHFLGDSGPEQERCYADVVSRIDFEPIEINLDYIGAWKHVESRWLGCSAPPASLAALVSRLGRALVACGHQPEKRPFIPHVTISRATEKHSQTETGFPAVRWLARDLVLAESVPDEGGVRYLVRVRRTCS